MLIYGINPVLEALRTGRVTLVRVSERASGRVDALLDAARREGVPVRRVAPAEIERAARGAVHQGVVAELDAPARLGIEDLIADRARTPLIVVLDGVEDPHNVGAILRTADAAGATGVIRQERHAAPLGGAAAKASAGAVSHVKIAEVVNIARAIETLKESGIWTVALAGDAETRYHDVDLKLPTAVVVGSEGDGVRRLVRERCDWVVSIPQYGHVESLNVSVAAGIVLFEAVRQRFGQSSTKGSSRSV